MSNKNILMVVTNQEEMDANHPTGLWFEEFAVPYQAFREAGLGVTVASPAGGRAPIDPRSAPDAEKTEKYAEALQVLENTQPLNSIEPDDYDAVFFPGGHGAMFDMPAAAVGRVVGHFADAGKVVAALCHGPAALVTATRSDGTPVVQGHRVTGFTNEEERAVQLDQLVPFLLETRLRELGAEYVPSPMWNDHVVVDGNLITGQNPRSSASTAQAVIEALASQE